MYFLNPVFLWASVLALIPLIIHWVRMLRVPEIPFPDIQLLREIEKEKKSIRRIVYWLILLCRTFFILFLVFAFSLPYKRKHPTGGTDNLQHYVFFVDNSLSMMNENAGGILLDQAKKWAEKWVQKLPPTSEIFVVDATGKFFSPVPVSSQKAIQQIRSIELKNNTLSWKECLSLIHHKISSGHQPFSVYIFSDFQKPLTSEVSRDSFPYFSYLHAFPLSPGIRQNACVDTAWLTDIFLRPGTRTGLKVRIRNMSEKLMENVLVRWYVRDQEMGIQTLSLSAKSTAECQFSWNTGVPGHYPAIIEIEDNALPFDNRLYLSFQVGHSIPVSIVHGQLTSDTIFLPALFRTDSVFSVFSVMENQVVWDRISSSRLLILNQVQEISPGGHEIIRRFVEEGKTLVYIPPPGRISPGGLPEYLKDAYPVLSPDTFVKIPEVPGKKSMFFEGVFENEKKDWKMPECKMHYPVEKNIFPVWKFTDGSVFVGRKIISGSKNIFLFSTPLGSVRNPFLNHPSAVPFFLNLGFSSVHVQPLYYYPFKNQRIPVLCPVSGENVCEVKKNFVPGSPASSFFMECVRELGSPVIYPFQYIKEEGFYEVLVSKQPCTLFSVNRLNAESEMKFCEESDFRQAFPGFPSRHLLWDDRLNNETYTEASFFLDREDVPLWKIMLVCSILCIFMEILLQVFFKKYT